MAWLYIKLKHHKSILGTCKCNHNSISGTCKCNYKSILSTRKCNHISNYILFQCKYKFYTSSSLLYLKYIQEPYTIIYIFLYAIKNLNDTFFYTIIYFFATFWTSFAIFLVAWSFETIKHKNFNLFLLLVIYLLLFLCIVL